MITFNCLRTVVPMMTSSNGNIFRVTGHLCEEFTGPRWIPRTKASTRSFGVFFDLRRIKQLNKQSWGWWLLIRYRAHYDVTVMHAWLHAYPLPTQTHRGAATTSPPTPSPPLRCTRSVVRMAYRSRHLPLLYMQISFFQNRWNAMFLFPGQLIFSHRWSLTMGC